MIRRAKAADLGAINEFLAQHQATSMFLSGNLYDQGLRDQEMKGSAHPKAMTVWFTEQAGRISNVFGYAEAGYFVFEAPEFLPVMYEELRSHLLGCRFLGLNGVADQAVRVLEALQLPIATASMDEVEPHYHISLADALLPEGASRLRAAHADDLDWLTDWRIASEVEILGGEDTAENRDRARASLADLLASDRLRVLEQDGNAVATTAFNAALPEIVQVGGVYTPSHLRGKGHARRAVALHLAEAHRTGVKEAILFAANPAASRAYEAIGFRLIGQYRVANFAQPVVLVAN